MKSQTETKIKYPNIKFGQLVIVDTKYTRWWKKRKDPRISSDRTYKYKYWKDDMLPIVTKTGKRSRNGIFLGYRTLFNGFLNRYYDEGITFDKLESFRVALVCLSEHENPIYVPIDNMKML